MFRNQVQFRQNVGNNILRSSGDSLVQLRHQLVGQDSMVFLVQAGLQAEIELAPTHCLGKEIRHASFVDGTCLRGKSEKDLCESIGESNPVMNGRQLVGADFHGYLDACFPASLLDIEHTDLCIGLSLHRFRPEEQRDAMG